MLKRLYRYMMLDRRYIAEQLRDEAYSHKMVGNPDEHETLSRKAHKFEVKAQRWQGRLTK